MNWMVMLAQLLLSLSFLVAVHEMGHLLAAKYFGMRVEQFSIGFPPKIWSFTKGETEYAISAIPLGGYVKISGMVDESLDTEMLKQEPQPWEFRSKPAWQRLIVMLGGIIVNLIVGVLIFIGVTYTFGDAYILKDEINKNGGFQIGAIGQGIGLKSGDKIVKINGKDYQYREDLINPEVLLGNGTYTVERDNQLIDIKIPADFIQKFGKKENGSFIDYRFPPVVEEVVKGSIAQKAGVKKGDLIVEVQGVPVKYFDEVLSIVTNLKAKSIAFKVSRQGQIIPCSGVFQKERIIGFRPATPEAFLIKAEHRIKYNLLQSIPLGAERAFSTLAIQVSAFGKMISGVLSPRESLSGPVGIAQAYGGTWEWERFWKLTGVLSLVLAFMNLLPIPALDGGHVAFISYEMISRRKPSDKFLETAQKVGMVFLLTLMVFIIANDIIKLF